MKLRALTWIPIASFAAALPIACGARTTIELSGSGGGDMSSASNGGQTPMSDAGAPTRDAAPDAAAEDCPRATHYIYALSDAIHRYDPTTNEWLHFGPVTCPGIPPYAIGARMASLAIDRRGNAYISTIYGRLFRQNLETMVCERMPFSPKRPGFERLGLTFVGSGSSESLYAVGQDPFGSSAGLAKIDTDTFALDFVTAFPTAIGGSVQIAGTGDDRLFGFYWAPRSTGTIGIVAPTVLDRFDLQQGTSLTDTRLDLGTMSQGDIGIAAWGQSLYLLTRGTGDELDLTRFDPSDGSKMALKSFHSGIDIVIVAIAASTCASE